MPDTAETPKLKDKPVRLYVSENALREQILEIYKLWLEQEDRKQRALHDSQSSGMKVVKARSHAIDQLLKHMFDYDLKAFESEYGKLPFAIGILALGGY